MCIVVSDKLFINILIALIIMLKILFKKIQNSSSGHDIVLNQRYRCSSFSSQLFSFFFILYNYLLCIQQEDFCSEINIYLFMFENFKNIYLWRILCIIWNYYIHIKTIIFWVCVFVCEKPTNYWIVIFVLLIDLMLNT